MSTDLKWLQEWFGVRGVLPLDDEALKNTNYFEAGLIDSMGVIELISELESALEVRFEQQHFQDRRFTTIGGLAEIIGELR